MVQGKRKEEGGGGAGEGTERGVGVVGREVVGKREGEEGRSWALCCQREENLASRRQVSKASSWIQWNCGVTLPV